MEVERYLKLVDAYLLINLKLAHLVTAKLVKEIRSILTSK